MASDISSSVVVFNSTQRSFLAYGKLVGLLLEVSVRKSVDQSMSHLSWRLLWVFSVKTSLIYAGWLLDMCFHMDV